LRGGLRAGVFVKLHASALRSPSADEIRLANEADLAIGKEAALVAADFSVEEDSVKLIEVEEQR
jgi:hypothetical protein